MQDAAADASVDISLHQRRLGSIRQAKILSALSAAAPSRRSNCESEIDAGTDSMSKTRALCGALIVHFLNHEHERVAADTTKPEEQFN